jgi:hypothetical protein
MTKPFRLTKPEPKEAQVLKAVIRALELHPSIMWVRRMNSGALKTIGGGFVRFGFVGCPDVWAQANDGRLVVVECKRPSGQPTKEQLEFITMVRSAGGIAFVARSADDVMTNLEGI